MVNKTREKKRREGAKINRGFIVISNEKAHETLQSILDYMLDLAQKSLETKDRDKRAMLNSKMKDMLDLSLYFTDKLYLPRLKRTKQK